MWCFPLFTENSILVNNNWKTDRTLKISSTEINFGKCCPYNFSQISYSISLTRRFEYHLFYLIVPCLSLALLTCVSFWIPTESGERIGFVTTIMLGMMVFLLVVPESLPESSQSIPVLGVLMMSTMLMVGLALLATVVVLRCYHATGRPPRYLLCLLKPSKRRKTVPETRSIQRPETNDKVLEFSDDDPAEGNLQPKEITAPRQLNVEDDNDWPSVSEKLNQIFFWLFIIIVIVLYLCTMVIPKL